MHPRLLLVAAMAALMLGGCDGESGPALPDRGGDSGGTTDTGGERGPAGDSAAGDSAADTLGPDALLCGGVSCDDKLACTEDLCVATGCTNKVKAGFCVIDNTCVKDGDKEGGPGSCRACDAAKSTSAWTEDVSLCASAGLTCVTSACNSGICSTTLAKGYCLISNVCVKHGDANPKNACRVCDITISTTGYQNGTDGTACADDGLGCTDDVCKTGACADPIKSGRCLISGACFYKDELSALQDCRVCLPTSSSTAWSTVADGTKCTDDGISCTTDTCKAGACVNALATGYCKINNTCYTSGATSSTSECQGCVPSSSTTSWSNKANGASCTADALSCTSDSCQGGVCSHKLMSNRCLINGACYSSGALSKTGPCQGCTPAVSASASMRAGRG